MDTVIPRNKDDYIQLGLVYEDIKETKLIEALSVLNADCRNAVLVGGGGSGKTLSLFKIWEHYSNNSNEINEVVFYIPLNICVSEKISISSYINYITMKYADGLSFSDILNQQEINLIILVDNYNEIKEIDQRNVVSEINDLSKNPKIQMLISLRNENNLFLPNEFRKYTFKDIPDEIIIDRVTKAETGKVHLTQEELSFFKNPMMLMMYCNAIKYRNNNILFDIHRRCFKIHMLNSVCTIGEVIFNYVESQLIKNWNSQNGKNYVHFLVLRYTIPYIAYQIYINEESPIGNYTLMNYIKDSLQECSKDYFLRMFDYLTDFKERIKKYKKNKDKFAIMVKDLAISTYGFLTYKDGYIEFSHSFLFDFFVSVYIKNSLNLYIESDIKDTTISKNVLSLSIRRMLGEILREHKNVPTSRESNSGTSTVLNRVLAKYRDIRSDEAKTSILNIIEIYKLLRNNDLSGEEFYGLDFSMCSLNGIIFSNNYKSSNFYSCYINENNLFSLCDADKIESVHCNTSGRKILSASISDGIKQWDCQTGLVINTVNAKAKKAIFKKYDENKIIAIVDNSKLIEYDFATNDERVLLRCGPNIINEIAFSNEDDKLRIWLSDRHVHEYDFASGTLAEIEGYNKYPQIDKPVSFRFPRLSRPRSATYSKDEKYVFSEYVCSNSESSYINVWDISSRSLVTQLQLPWVRYSNAHQKYFALTDKYKIIELETIEDFIAEYKSHKHYSYADYKYIDYNKKHKSVVMVDNNDNIVITKTNSTYTQNYTVSIKKEKHSHIIQTAILDKFAKSILLATNEGSILEMDIESGVIKKMHNGHSPLIFARYTDTDDILSISKSALIKIWQRGQEKPDDKYEGLLGIVNSIAYNSDGKKLISVSKDSTIKEWNTSTTECISTFYEGLHVNNCIFQNIHTDMSIQKKKLLKDCGAVLL